MNMADLKFEVKERIAYNKNEHALMVKSNDREWCIESWNEKPDWNDVQKVINTFKRGCEFTKDVIRSEVFKLL
jgi:hypothetical protein